MLGQMFQTFIAFVKSLYENGFTQFFNWFNSIIAQLTPAAPNTQITSFLGAFLDLFFPFPVIITIITVYVPFMASNFVIALVLRVKSFIPTMGGK